MPCVESGVLRVVTHLSQWIPIAGGILPAVRIAPRDLDVALRLAPELNDPGLYLNRELSSLAFNDRVLEQACDPSVPPVERLKFLSIFSSNLDEFFMIRVAGLKQQLAGGVEERPADALNPSDVLREISERAHELVARQYGALSGDLLKALERGYI